MRKRRTAEELRKASDHLHYEIGMMQTLARGMSTGVFGEGPVNNAVLEAFIIHVRNLIHFLYANNPNRDHVIAADFFDSPEEWKTLRIEKTEIIKKAEIRSHKELAHLSYDRIMVTPETKPWAFIEIANEISTAFGAFLGKVSPDLLGESWEPTIQAGQNEKLSDSRVSDDMASTDASSVVKVTRKWDSDS